MWNDGKLKIGTRHTHLDPESPFIKFHHLNWRYKAIENIKLNYDEKLHYSGPTTIGKKDALLVRAEIVKLLERVGEIIDPSPDEELMCLNIDWFKLNPFR